MDASSADQTGILASTVIFCPLDEEGTVWQREAWSGSYPLMPPISSGGAVWQNASGRAGGAGVCA